MHIKQSPSWSRSQLVHKKFWQPRTSFLHTVAAIPWHEGFEHSILAALGSAACIPSTSLSFRAQAWQKPNANWWHLLQRGFSHGIRLFLHKVVADSWHLGVEQGTVSVSSVHTTIAGMIEPGLSALSAAGVRVTPVSFGPCSPSLLAIGNN
jgi:hypothetical protein